VACSRVKFTFTFIVIICTVVIFEIRRTTTANVEYKSKIHVDSQATFHEEREGSGGITPSTFKVNIKWTLRENFMTGRFTPEERQQVSTEQREPGDILDAATKRNISGPEENRTPIPQS
jgi:hypothetical protein